MTRSIVPGFVAQLLAGSASMRYLGFAWLTHTHFGQKIRVDSVIPPAVSVARQVAHAFDGVVEERGGRGERARGRGVVL